jgi:ATP-dependent helicase/nuclease subunit B
MVPDVMEQIASRPDQAGAADVATRRELVSGLLQWARRDGAEKEAGWPALYQWLARRKKSCEAWKALSYENRAQLSAATAVRLFGRPLNAEARQLESFAACPFQHFARYGLRLRDRGRAGLSGWEIWRLSADVMCGVLRRAGDWGNLSDREVEQLVAEELEEASQRTRQQAMLGEGRLHYLVEWLTMTLVQTVRAQRQAERRGQFKPAQGRVIYGQGKELPALRIGDDLLLSGKIDRVDVDAGGSAVIYDYRLSADKMNLSQMYYGLSLGLAVDALAWEQARSSRPVAMLVASMERKIENEDPHEMPDDERFDLRVKPRGIISEAAAARLDSALAEGTARGTPMAYAKNDVIGAQEMDGLLRHVRSVLQRLAGEILSGRVEVKPYRLGDQTPCARCDYRDVCRFEPSQGYAPLPVMKRSDVLAKVGG